MLNILIKHEFQNLLKSRRVYLTVIMFLLLFTTIFVVRVIDFQKQINGYIADVKLNDEELTKVKNYSHLQPRAIQQPLVFSIYNQGYKFPRVINIQYYEPIVSSTSLNEEMYLLHRGRAQVDITFFITFFLSLFILLISYDSINGEKRVGTLRLMMTYPLKRQSFILKKIVGIFIFVSLAFLIPYIFSLISLVIIYADLLTVSFFLSAFFYGFLIILFIFFFSLLGILISICTTNPNRSLVYSLLIWMLLAIILPISWEYIAVPNLYNSELNKLTRIFEDKIEHGQNVRFRLVPEDIYAYQIGFVLYKFATFSTGYDSYYKYFRYIYDSYYPVSREAEQARDEIMRKQINISNTKNWVFFYNPIVLLTSLSAKIAGNSLDDYLKFFHDSREVRDELVNLGVKEGWLFDYRYFATYKKEDQLAFEGKGRGGWDNELWTDIQTRNERYEMTVPSFSKYNQPQHSFGEIFSRILPFLTVFVLCIVALWIMTWIMFKRYDVR